MNGRPFDKLRANVETIIITDNGTTGVADGQRELPFLDPNFSPNL